MANHDVHHGDNHEDDDDDCDSHSTLNSKVEEPTFAIPESTDKHSTSTLQVEQTKCLYLTNT